jgi:hypothetical protein
VTFPAPPLVNQTVKENRRWLACDYEEDVSEVRLECRP